MQSTHKNDTLKWKFYLNLHLRQLKILLLRGVSIWNSYSSNPRLLVWSRLVCMKCLIYYRVTLKTIISSRPPTVSWANHSRFSCMALTHHAWVSANSPAINSPVATETPCCQGHRGSKHEPEQVSDRPSRENLPLTPSCVASGVSVPSFTPLLHLPKLCPGRLSLTLLRSSIAWDNRDYQ